MAAYFGTICVRDNKRNEYSEAYLKLLLHFRDLLQARLEVIRQTLHSQLEQHEAKIRRLVGRQHHRDHHLGSRRSHS